MDAGAYDDLLDDLAAAVDDRAGADGDATDAVWTAVGDVVPQLTEPVCERVLELSDTQPDEALVDHVTSERASDDAERLRAEAVTALVGDLETRLAGPADGEA